MITSPWNLRINNANKAYDAWSNKFKCNILEKYYENNQWENKKDRLNTNYQPYSLNLFYSTIKIKLASLIFQKPTYLVSPRPGNSDWSMDLAVKSANMKQDVLNTLIQNPRVKFVNNARLCAIDSYLRFGMLEIGYAADWRNPIKDDPLLSDHEDEDVQKIRVIKDEPVAINERMYFKRINPKRFRVAVCEAEELENHEWVGYYQFYYTKILKELEGIKWPDAYDDSYISSDLATMGSGIVESSTSSVENEHIRKMLAQGQITKVWHIWDLISMERLMLIDGSFDEIWSGGFDRLPLVDLRWDLRTEGWYPMPPAFQWVSPQDEINEAREQTRSYRRRFTRKFQAVKGKIEPEEIEKFTSGSDGVVIEVNEVDAISPIGNPDQTATTTNALLIAKDDFNIISGTSAEARGQTDRETATQAKIIDARSQIRESADQLDFSEWMCRIGRECLTQAQEKLTEGLWAKYTADPADDMFEEMQVQGPTFKYIKAQDISDGYDFDIDLDVTNATPEVMAQQEQSFTKFLALVQGFPVVSMSPTLIREAAYSCGYRNERVIAQMQQAAIASMQAKAIQAQSGQPQQPNPLTSGQGGGNPQSTLNAQTQTPGGGQISTQLNNQLQ